MLNFVKGFFCIYWDDNVFLSFILFMCYIKSMELYTLNHPCIPGMEPTWSWCMIFLNVLLNLVCKYFIERFCACVHQGTWSIVLFFSSVIILFGYQSTTGFIGWDTSASSLPILQNNLRSIGVNYLKLW
jgi:hypothetical protein